MSQHVIGPRPCAVCGGPLLTTVARLTKPDYTCLHCARAALLRWRQHNRAHATEYMRAYLSDPAKRRKKNAQHKRYVHENRDKINARIKVRRALRSGRLVKLPCAVCGAAESWAHHEDYGQPLIVTWLCRQCHFDRHVERADLRRVPETAPTASAEVLAKLPKHVKARSIHHKRFFGRSA